MHYSSQFSSDVESAGTTLSKSEIPTWDLVVWVAISSCRLYLPNSVLALRPLTVNQDDPYISQVHRRHDLAENLRNTVGPKQLRPTAPRVWADELFKYLKLFSSATGTREAPSLADRVESRCRLHASATGWLKSFMCTFMR